MRATPSPPMTSLLKAQNRRQLVLKHEFVDTIPPHLEPGILYLSKRFRTAIHKCCCGCDLEVVTPLNSAKWTLTEHGTSVSLSPSIGNWSFPCRSHYWIERDQVRWAAPMNARQIVQVQQRDREDVQDLASAGHQAGPLHSLWQRVLRFFGFSE